MRTISRISAACQVLDSYSKGPVLGASVLVDGRRVRYVAKGDGTYVFTDLPLVPHVYEISAHGYCTVRITLPAAPIHFPEVVLLQHAPGGAFLGKIAYFRLRFSEGERPLGDACVRAVLRTNVGSLRLVAPAGAGERTLSLAGGYALGMLYQKCCPQSAPEETVLLTGYDKAAGQYELQDPLTADLPQGTLLRPVWDLITDRDGVAILPAIGLFLQREEVEFTFSWKGKEQQLMTAPPSPSLSAAVTF